MRNKIKAAALGLVLAGALILGLGVPANAAVYFGCPAGTGCVWIDKDGGSSMYIMSFSNFGPHDGSDLGPCHLLPPGFQDEVSSASSDYGGGYSLMLYDFSDCTAGSGLNHFKVTSSSFVNFTGSNFYFNDVASAMRICRYPCIHF